MKCFIAAGLLSAALLAGCSDEREPVPALPDAAAPADVAVSDAGGHADVSVDAAGDAPPINLFDVFPLGDAGCPACIRDRCGAQINACINNPACANGLFCTLQMCAGGLVGGDGGFTPTDLVCVLGCFNGDQATAFMAIGSLTCITMTCGGSCSLGDAAAIDVRPDTPVQPDASHDVTSEEQADASAPETGTTPDATNADVDASAPPNDVSADTAPETSAPSDTGPETADPVDTGSSSDTAPDLAPPSQDSAAD
jgi:hypothetical protein